MKPIKLMIKKGGPFGYSWYRHVEVPGGRLLIDETSSIKTEGQLANLISKKWGQGRYQILAWQGGYEGFWLFWLGEIGENGFLREKNVNKDLKKAKEEYQKRMTEVETYEEKKELVEEMEDDLSFEREFAKDTKSSKRRGPMGIKTNRPGEWHRFEEY